MIDQTHIYRHALVVLYYWANDIHCFMGFAVMPLNSMYYQVELI